MEKETRSETILMEPPGPPLPALTIAEEKERGRGRERKGEEGVKFLSQKAEGQYLQTFLGER